MEVEKFHYKLIKLKEKGEIEIQSEERLKCELKRFGLNELKEFNKDILSKE